MQLNIGQGHPINIWTVKFLAVLSLNKLKFSHVDTCLVFVR